MRARLRIGASQTVLVLLLAAFADGNAIPYRWVKPPPHLKATNVAPSSLRVASASGSVATGDGQAVVTLPAGVVGPVAITPLDPASLGEVQGGLAPAGNAYRIEVPAFAGEGSVVLVAPYAPQALLFSADGRGWRAVEGARVVGTDGYGSRLVGAGYYLVGGVPQTPVQGIGGRGRRPLLVIGAAVGLGFLGFLALAWPLLRSRGGGNS
jgi:hypothetical protein